MNIRSFWIRKDRESYFLTGVIIACTIGGFVSSYWHFTDRISVRQNIKMREAKPTERQQQKLRDTQYAPIKSNAGATRYYRLDEESKPSVPKMGEDEGN